LLTFEELTWMFSGVRNQVLSVIPCEPWKRVRRLARNWV
jgi:hypothetical protein